MSQIQGTIKECHIVQSTDALVYRVKMLGADGKVQEVDLKTAEAKLLYVPVLLPFIKQAMDAETEEAGVEYQRIYKDLVKTIREAMGVS